MSYHNVVPFHTDGTMNRLASESSLYLRQHATNPVDWYPWGPEALGRARADDKPIFLSIGYSACHWCHVMEHESFEDAATAEFLNAHFVNIKVDREERPDLDAIYMAAVQMLNRGQGGWPMSVWLTPEQRPFYAGTYFPPDDRYGRPSFRRVLLALADAWQNRRGEIVASSAELTASLAQFGTAGEPGGEPTPELLRRAAGQLRRAYDSVHGGFGHAPKFPHALELRVLLRTWHRFGDTDALDMARHTLDRMARGGIYDHLSGGFHRYSVDARWLVPHFEKMLYDNALLPVTYLETFQATGDPFYRRVVEETLDYVAREMTSPSGGFYSTQDADSEGEEGKFFVWSEDEIVSILGRELAEVFTYVYGVTPGGNFEGHNILNRAKTDEQDAKLLRLSPEELKAKLTEGRRLLLEARSERIAPGRDEKILTAWNGWMIAAFARAGAVLDRPDYVAVADKAADFVLRVLRRDDGSLYRTSSADGGAKFDGYLEDYASLADALTWLYEATFDAKRLTVAAEIVDAMLDRFRADDGTFYTTGRGHEELIVRMKDVQDGSTPSGNAMAVTALARLAVLLSRDDYGSAADAALRALAGLMERSPTAAGQLLIALDFRAGPVQEVAVVGDHEAVVKAARRSFAPRRVVVVSGDLPLLRGRPNLGDVTTYICENGTCQAPAVGTDAAAALLG